MARVNHKKVKQLIQQKRGKITDQEFFTSRLLACHFEDMAAAQTKRYGASRRVRVRLLWQPGNPELAYTDNLYITINAGNPAITEFPTREERYQMVLGLFAHELGHCETGAFYNRYAARDIRQKHENRANKWAYKKLVPEDELKQAFLQGYHEPWELAEYFGVTEAFLRGVLNCYLKR